MSRRDYYEILGVERDASPEDIKKAYRQRALEHHPDRNPGDHTAEEKFKEATEAYEVLHDPEKRTRFDQFGHAGVDGGLGGGAGPDFGGFDLSDALRAFMRDFGGLDDLFGGGFGAAQDPRAARRGRNLQLQLTLSLEEIASGVTKKIKLKRYAPCETCRGSGARAGSKPENCSTCGGQGRVRHVQRSLLGQFVSVSPCPACGGAGETIGDPCPDCRGEGRAQVTETISVDVPAGVQAGNYIPIPGKGHVGQRGGPAGDLIILIEEKAHGVFERHGADLICDLPVSFPTAVLGGKVDVPTISGTARLEVPAGTQSGKTFRMRGQGLPQVHGSKKGDLLVRVRVWTPKKISRDERLLLEKLSEVQGSPPAPKKGVFDRIRDSFHHALFAIVLLALLAPAARADLNDVRSGEANPMISVFKSTIYGGLAGLVLGGAVALVDDDGSAEPVRWGFVGGTFFGFAYGLYHVATRPSSSLLETDPSGEWEASWPRVEIDGRPSAEDSVLPELDAEVRVRVPLVGLRF